MVVAVTMGAVAVAAVQQLDGSGGGSLVAVVT